MTDKLLTLKEVAEILRVSTKTVQRIVKRAELAAVKLGDGRSPLLFRPTDLDNYIGRRVQRYVKTARGVYPSKNSVRLNDGTVAVPESDDDDDTVAL